MVSAYPAPVLQVWLGDVNTRWPGRSKASDGWIGDEAHQKTTSDHNPDGRGMVHARDFTTDGLDPAVLVAALIKHPSTQYVIWNRTIWSRTRGMAPARYTGSDPHTGHVHVSIQYSPLAERSSQHLNLGGGSVNTVPAGGGRMMPMPTIRRGWKAGVVHTAQACLRLAGDTHLANDGDFGRGTQAAVVLFQASHGLDSDGVVGPRTWVALAQAALKTRGFDPGPVDGDFGPRTAAAVRALQAARGITVDGILGPDTWAKLS